MLDKLGDALKNSMKNFISSIFVDETTLNKFVNDIQRALLQGDVAVDLVFRISENIKKRAKEEIGKAHVAKEHIVKIVYEELVAILGEEGSKIVLTEKPFKILLIGLFGNGKSTSSAKIARFFQNRGKKVALVAADTYRPAAYEQIVQLGDQIKVPVYGNDKEKNAANIIKEFGSSFPRYDVVIVDSSGRDALKQDMIDEITSVKNELKPNEVLLVQGADIGQGAKDQATAFKKALDITGVVLTKMEGTAKGGGAITACSIAEAPIKFIGVGEKVSDLEEFDPKRFVSRLLGLGDIETLLEKAKEMQTSHEDAKGLEKRIMSGKFTLVDFRNQMDAMSKMGPLSKIVNMIPGMGMANIPSDMLSVQEDKLKKYRYVIDSMTPEERENPDVLHMSRMERIARGSGVDISEVKELIKSFNQMRKMFKKMKGKDMEKLAKRFGKGKMPFGM